MSPELDDETREKLRQVSTATLTTLLIGQGYPECFMRNVHPVAMGKRRMVGEASTLRLIPARGPMPRERDYKTDVQRLSIENMPPGNVLVVDSRGDASAASAGEILITRLQARGVEGAVTDGGFRDSPSIATFDIPTFHSRPSAPPITKQHHPVEADCPIACGGIAVYPGDVIVGDDEGVVVIPRGLAGTIVDEAVKKENVEQFIALCVAAGESTMGLYPPTPQVYERFEAWEAAGRPAYAHLPPGARLS